MKNYRNGRDDTSPPLDHYGRPPAHTALRLGEVALVFVQGPAVHPLHVPRHVSMRDALEDCFSGSGVMGL